MGFKRRGLSANRHCVGGININYAQDAVICIVFESNVISAHYSIVIHLFFVVIL